MYRPAVSDSPTLPVVYFLHGVPGSAQDVFGAGLAQALDDAFIHAAPPFVLASPDGNGIHHEDTEWADAVDGSDQIETRLLDAVIPAVEGTNPRDRAHRAIAGFSMGGYGAINLAERHTDVFSQVVSIAGYFHVNDPGGMFGTDPSTIDANSPDRRIMALTDTRILLTDGQDDQEPVVRGEASRFDTVLRAAGIEHRTVLAPGVHDFAFLTSQFPPMIDFLEQGWR